MPVVSELDNDGVPKVLLVSLRGRLFVIDGRSGQVLWSPEVASKGTGALEAEVPEAMDNGTGRVGGHPSVLRIKGRTLILAPLGPAGVVAFDWATRSEVWRSPLGFPVIASPVCADWAGDGRSQVVVASSTGDIFVLDAASGAPLWHKRIGDRSNGSETFIEGDPVVTDVDGDGVPDILVAGLDFHLYALNGLGPLSSLPRLVK